MSRFWSPLVERLSPYTPGEQADARRFLKLNTNESPFAPSPEVLRAICEAANADLRLYPEPGSDRLRSAISRTYGVPAESIFVGNGADCGDGSKYFSIALRQEHRAGITFQ